MSLSLASTLALTAILEAACQPTDHLTAVDSELPLRRQLHSLASQGNSSLGASAAVTYQADSLNV